MKRSTLIAAQFSVFALCSFLFLMGTVTGPGTKSGGGGAQAVWGTSDSAFANFTQYIRVNGATLQKMQRVYARAFELGRTPLTGAFGMIGDSFANADGNYRTMGIEGPSADSTGGNWHTAFRTYAQTDTIYSATTAIFVKGVEHGNLGGWTLAQLYNNEAVDSCLVNSNVSWAILIIGVNDIGSGFWAIDQNPGRIRDDWGDSLSVLCDRFDSAGVVVWLGTRSPIASATEPGWMSADQLELDRQIRRVAAEDDRPLADYRSAFLGIAADSTSMFWGDQGGQSGMVLSSDLVHPTKCDSCATGVPRPVNMSREAYEGECGYCVMAAINIQIGQFMMDNVFADDLAWDL